MRVLIVGGGPAGMLAALLARRAGCAVRLVENGPGSPQDRHVHILRPGLVQTLGALEPGLGSRLAAATEPAHRWIGADGAIRSAPRLTRPALVEALAACFAEAGIAPESADTATLSPSEADLRIDASGGARALARAWEARGLGALALDDLGTPEIWRTCQWNRPLPGAPFTLVMQGRLYLEAGLTRTRATGPEGDWPRLPAGFSLPQEAPLSRLRMGGPPVRRAHWRGVPLVLLGDALLQTPPSMGFGLMALAQQATLLSRALRDGSDPASPLSDWAEDVWMTAGLQNALMEQAPALA